MSKNNIINVVCFDHEIGRIGYDEHQNKSFFQYNPTFLKSGLHPNLFPLVIKRIAQTQVFSQFNNDTFKNLPPMFADSLPDTFGNVIFKTWLEAKGIDKINVLEQLAYVSNRGMGALEYQPSIHIPRNTSIDIDAIINILKQVLDSKSSISDKALDSKSLLNIFKMGSSAGGMQPKILIAENKKTGKIIPGDVEYSNAYHHYLVKLHLTTEEAYNKEIIEYTYYLTATALGIRMMPSKLIDNRHFATLRYDRQEGQKVHSLTASGITGWDFKNPAVSSYERLFDLANFLKLPHAEVDELFARMVFNLVFANADDHLKNHAFTYDPKNNQWHLAPAYDITYALNPLLTYKRSSRALSINNKRNDITLADILDIAHQNTIKNPKAIIDRTIAATAVWEQQAQQNNIPDYIIENIKKNLWFG